MNKELTKISKHLSYVLRHKPESIGLYLDPQGWASIEDLISKTDFPLNYKVLKETVEQNDKKRFSISDDGSYIRANQGHSTNIDLGLRPIEPPYILFHGTADRFLDSIMKKGLLPQQRHHVHLSTNIQTAKKVGQRHGNPIILTIKSKNMHDQGFEFFLSTNEVWLCKEVPPKFLSIQNS